MDRKYYNFCLFVDVQSIGYKMSLVVFFCILVSTSSDNSSLCGQVNSLDHWDLPSRDRG